MQFFIMIPVNFFLAMEVQNSLHESLQESKKITLRAISREEHLHSTQAIERGMTDQRK